MKGCILFGSIVVMVLAFASAAVTGEEPGSGIQNTCHDLRSEAVGTVMETADPRERICFYCHTPHSAMTPGEAAPNYAHYPIWSHAASIASFQTYSSGTDTIGQPGRISRVCLSCHDGSVATSIYGYVSPVAIGTERRMRKSNGIFFKFNDGMNSGRYDNRSELIPHHHPIGFDYGEVVSKDEEIKPAASSLRGSNIYGMTIEDLLWSGRLECSSCHDVHNTKNEGSRLTWVEDGLSNLCFTCHNK